MMNTIVKVNGHLVDKVKMQLDMETNQITFESSINKQKKIDLERNVVVVSIYGQIGEQLFPKISIVHS